MAPMTTPKTAGSGERGSPGTMECDIPALHVSRSTPCWTRTCDLSAVDGMATYPHTRHDPALDVEDGAEVPVETCAVDGPPVAGRQTVDSVGSEGRVERVFPEDLEFLPRHRLPGLVELVKGFPEFWCGPEFPVRATWRRRGGHEILGRNPPSHRSLLASWIPGIPRGCRSASPASRAIGAGGPQGP